MTRGPTPEANIGTVRSAYLAALRGDLDALAEVLAEDVRWHAAGDERGGCQNRDQALVWMGQGIARGLKVDLLDVRPLDENRVLVRLQRHGRSDGDASPDPPPPRGQIVTFRGDKVSEIVVYATDEAAIEAAANA